MSNDAIREPVVKLADISREEWLTCRRLGLGGSDAATVVGLNPYGSLYYLYNDKLGLLPEKDDTEAMRQGRDLEQYVADRWMERTGKRCRRNNYMWRSKAVPFMLADIDREVVGENAGLECKTTSVYNRSDFQAGEIPLNYYVQCQHYMAVMGFDRMYLAVLVRLSKKRKESRNKRQKHLFLLPFSLFICVFEEKPIKKLPKNALFRVFRQFVVLNRGFYDYTIERDDAEIAALVKQERSFWEDHLLPRRPPDLDGSEATAKALAALYPENASIGALSLSRGQEDALRRYQNMQADIKALKDACDAIKADLQAAMGDLPFACGERFDASWKCQSRTSLDAKRLKADHPEIYKQYSKSTASRVFRLTEKR